MIWYNLPFVLATVLLIVLRKTGVIHWPWAAIFIPTYLHIALIVVGLTFAILAIKSAN